MKLKDGKTYKNRIGQIITVNLVTPNSDFPFIGSNHMAFMTNGKYIPGEGFPVNDFDLISEESA